MCLRTWPPQNNGIIDVLMALTNANRVWYIIHEISGWWKYDVLGENPNQTSRPEREREQVWCSFHENSPIFSSSSSSSPAFLQVPSVTDVILSWHLSALSSCLAVLSPSLWGGTVCLWRFVYGGRNTPLLQAASSLSAHHTEHDSPPSLWCWDELFLLSPWGVRISASFSPSWTSLQDSRSILCAWANATCFGPYTQTLCNFAIMWIEVTYQFSPRGLNVSLSVQIYRIVFFPPHIILN